MSDEDIERFEDDMELRLWREYRDVLPMFAFVVETERRFYLANHVDVAEHDGAGGPWFEVKLSDAWVWDMYRPARFVASVRVVTTADVNVEELAHKDIAPADAFGKPAKQAAPGEEADDPGFTDAAERDGPDASGGPDGPR